MQSMNAFTHATAAQSADACYQVLRTRDARFDGRFFIGVTSTRIYCRPVCKVRVPKRENCRFFDHAAQAEGAGFRPCLRCRPELAPQNVAGALNWSGTAGEGESLPWSIQDASSTLGLQAARLLDEPDAWGTDTPSAAKLAARLGVSDRHLRRIFETQFGVSPLQYLQTRRLLTAKQLLTDTQLPVTDIAHMAGFASLRRFNAAFVGNYRLSPSRLRKEGGPLGAGHRPAGQADNQAVTKVRLGYRTPYDIQHLLQFLQKRALNGLDFVDLAQHRTGRTLSLASQGQTYSGWVLAKFLPDYAVVEVQLSDGLRGVLPLLLRRVRHWLDLDADPAAIHARLQGHFATGAGLRVPGSLDGFELAVRAILGQQISVAAARTLAQRLLLRFGTPIATPFYGPAHSLTHIFPSAQVLAQAGGDALGQLGIVKTRQAAIMALATEVAAGRIALHAGADVAATMAALTALPGFGDWTANYIAMRCLRWPDAFVAGDVALHKALGLDRSQSPTRLAKEAEAQSQVWRPWRSYAVVRAWASLAV